jgi:hypothetical protein
VFDGPDLSVLLRASEGATWIDPGPSPDVSKLPGASFVGQLAYETQGIVVRAGCVRGPSDRFAPGIEGVLFERATFLVNKVAGVTPAELFVTSTTTDAPVLEQRLLGHERNGGELAIKHALTFVGADSDVLLCSVVCVGRTATGAGGQGDGPCARALDGFTIAGTPAPPPDPSLLVRSVFYVAEHPSSVLAGLALAGALAIAALLRFRPYPRP